MDFAFLNGQFASGSTFWDDGYLWDITYRQHEVDVTAVQAPEPSSLLLLLIGLAALGFYTRREMDKTQRLA
jgi:PEP-CTERM motif